MTRAGFTVKLKSGTAYDANHLACTYRDGDLTPMLAFVCSGRMTVIEADQVEAVEFRAGGIQYCNECDQSLYGIGGGSNPPGPEAG